MSVEVAVVALVAVVAGSLLKSISGIGLPIITIPLISYVADLETAVAVTAVPNLALNAGLAWRERRSLPDTRDLLTLGGFGFGGAILGTLVLVSVPEDPLILLLLVVVLAYATLFFTDPGFSLDQTQSRRFAPLVGAVAGTLQGTIGISGPILVPWVHSYRLPRSPHILSVTALFAAAGVAQVPTLVVSEKMAGRWTVALIACIPALATIPVGARLRQALSSRAFDRLVVATLVASVVVLAVRAYV